jgi:hypothetical protein
MAGIFVYGWEKGSAGHVGALLFAMILGALGASISLLKRASKKNMTLLEQLKQEKFLDHPWDYSFGVTSPRKIGPI